MQMESVVAIILGKGSMSPSAKKDVVEGFAENGIRVVFIEFNTNAGVEPRLAMFPVPAIVKSVLDGE